MINEKLASVQLGIKIVNTFRKAIYLLQNLLNKYLQVKWDHKNDRPTDRRVDVATDVLVVEGDVDPSTRACQPSSHCFIKTT